MDLIYSHTFRNANRYSRQFENWKCITSKSRQRTTHTLEVLNQALGQDLD